MPPRRIVYQDASPERSRSHSRRGREITVAEENYLERRSRRDRTPTNTRSSSSRSRRSRSHSRPRTPNRSVSRSRTEQRPRSRSRSKPRPRSRSSSRAGKRTSSFAALMTATEDALEEFFTNPATETTTPQPITSEEEEQEQTIFSNPKVDAPPKPEQTSTTNNNNEIVENNKEEKEHETVTDKKRTISHDTNVGPAEVFVHSPSNLDWIKKSERQKMGLDTEQDGNEADAPLRSQQLVRSSTSVQDMMMTYVATWCTGNSPAPKAIKAGVDDDNDAASAFRGDKQMKLDAIYSAEIEDLRRQLSDLDEADDDDDATQATEVEHDADGLISVSGEQEKVQAKKAILLMKKDLEEDAFVDTRARDIEAVLSFDDEEEEEDEDATTPASEAATGADEKSVPKKKEIRLWRKKKQKSPEPPAEQPNENEENTDSNNKKKSPVARERKTVEKQHKRSASVGLPRPKPQKKDEKKHRKSSSFGLPPQSPQPSKKRNSRSSATQTRGRVIRSSSLDPGGMNRWRNQRSASRSASRSRMSKNLEEDSSTNRRSWVFRGRKRHGNKENERQRNGGDSTLMTDESNTLSASYRRDDDDDSDGDETDSSNEYKNDQQDYTNMKRASEDLVEPIFQAALDAAKMLEKNWMDTAFDRTDASVKSETSDLSAPKHPGQVFFLPTEMFG